MIFALNYTKIIRKNFVSFKNVSNFWARIHTEYKFEVIFHKKLRKKYRIFFRVWKFKSESKSNTFVFDWFNTKG